MKRFVCLFTVLITAAVLLVAGVEAQPTSIAVDITKAKLTWAWTQGTGGAVASFQVKCGPTTGTYNILVSLPDPAARACALSTVVPTIGKYFCVVSAKNVTGESSNSNEVSFTAGLVPATPTNLLIQAQ